MCLQYGFAIFWRKDFGAIAAHKMSVKLMPGGSMAPGNVLPLLLGEKLQKLLITHQPLKLVKK
jgi:hypothetical protein